MESLWWAAALHCAASSSSGNIHMKQIKVFSRCRSFRLTRMTALIIKCAVCRVVSVPCCSFLTVWPIFTICLVLKNEARRPGGYINKWPFYPGPCPPLLPLGEAGKCPVTSRCPTAWSLLLQRTWLTSIQSLSGDHDNDASMYSVFKEPKRPWSAVFSANTHWNRPGLRIAGGGRLPTLRSS